MKKLVIFDVCGTIVNANSTYDYINFLIKKGIKKHYRIFFIDKIFINIFYYFFFYIFKKDFKQFLSVKFMKGLNKKELEELNKEFYKRYDTKIKKTIFNELIELNKKEDTILLSASINPPIDYLKEKYDLKGFSSLLEENDGKYTGNLLVGLWGQKEKIFKEKLLNLEKYNEIEFYTDNKDDISLIDYFLIQNKKLKVYIVPYNNIDYWKNYFSNIKIEYEFIH